MWTDGLCVEMRKRKSKYLWMAVDADEYELPIFIADSAGELAEQYGLSKQCIITSTSDPKCTGRYKGHKFIKVLRNE